MQVSGIEVKAFCFGNVECKELWNIQMVGGGGSACIWMWGSKGQWAGQEWITGRWFVVKIPRTGEIILWEEQRTKNGSLELYTDKYSDVDEGKSFMKTFKEERWEG